MAMSSFATRLCRDHSHLTPYARGVTFVELPDLFSLLLLTVSHLVKFLVKILTLVSLFWMLDS